MKKYFGLLLGFVLLILVACSPSKSLKSNEIVLFEGDMLPISLEIDKIDDYQIDKKYILEDTSGYICALQNGEAKLNINYENGKEHEINFKIKERKIQDIDVENNTLLLEELRFKIEKYKKKTKKSNYYSVYVPQNTTDGGKMVLKMRANPLQIEVKDEKYQIITKEKDGFYQYNNLSYNKYGKTIYAEDENEFNLKFDAAWYYFDAEKMFDFEFNPETGEIYKNEDYYILHAYYKDCINDEMKEVLEQELNQQGIDGSLIFDSIATIYCRFTDESFIFGITIVIKDKGYSVPVSLAIRADLKKVEMTNLSELDLVTKAPSNFDEVYEETDILNEKIQIGGSESTTTYILTTLEKGQYSIDGFHGHEYNIFDENRNLINYSYIDGFDSTFYIPEKGKYYFEFKKDNPGVILVSLRKLNYQTEANPNNPSTLETKQITLEGVDDLEYYEIYNNSKNNQIAVITNTGKSSFTVYHRPYNDLEESNIPYKTVKKEEACYIKLRPGKNKIVITDEEFESNQVHEYSFEFVIGDLINKKTSLESGIKIEKDKVYAVEIDDTTNAVYFEIVVQEKTLYKYEILSANKYEKLGGSICDANDGYVPRENYYYVLEPGKYFLKVHTNIALRNVIVFSINEEYRVKQYIDNDVTLPIVNDKYRYYYDSVIILDKKDNIDEYRYHFTLEKEEKIYLGANHKLYDEDGTLLIGGDYYPRGATIILLSPGNYYFITSELEKARVAIVEDIELESYLYGKDPVEIEIGESYEVNKEWDGDIEFFFFTTSEAGEYRIRVPKGMIYTDGYQALLYTSDAVITLEGDTTYYLIVDYEYNDVKETIGIYKI